MKLYSTVPSAEYLAVQCVGYGCSRVSRKNVQSQSTLIFPVSELHFLAFVCELVYSTDEVKNCY